MFRLYSPHDAEWPSCHFTRCFDGRYLQFNSKKSRKKIKKFFFIETFPRDFFLFQFLNEWHRTKHQRNIPSMKIRTWWIQRYFIQFHRHNQVRFWNFLTMSFVYRSNDRFRSSWNRTWQRADQTCCSSITDRTSTVEQIFVTFTDSRFDRVEQKIKSILFFFLKVSVNG